MVGHKYNLIELLQDLKAEGIKYTSTEFCQGRVTRWGLAWTYQDYDLYKLLPRREKLRKKNTPITYLLPKITSNLYDVESVIKKIKSILDDLKISYKILNKRGNHISLDIVAITNTWSHQRRKKRHLKRLEECEVKKRKHESGMQDTSASDCHNSLEVSETSTDDINLFQNNVSETNKSNDASVSNTSSEGNLYMDSEPVVHAFVKIFKRDDDIILQMDFLDGIAGKEGLHQILQYIKNNWK